MKKDTKERSYVGKEVFIGIDVHKKTYTVVAVANHYPPCSEVMIYLFSTNNAIVLEQIQRIAGW